MHGAGRVGPAAPRARCLALLRRRLTTFGLVHGAYHGAWCWDLLIPELERLGHSGIAMDLPSEDPEAGAARYAEAVAGALQGAQGEVVVVGHSLGGLTIPLVAERRLVRHLVFLAALVPEPGLSFDEAANRNPPWTTFESATAAVTNPDGSTSCPPARAIETFYQDVPEEVARWAAVGLRPQRWRVTQEVTLLARRPEVPATYVLCTDDRAISTEWSRGVARRWTGRPALELPGGHSPFLSRPAELAALLSSVVG